MLGVALFADGQLSRCSGRRVTAGGGGELCEALSCYLSPHRKPNQGGEFTPSATCIIERLLSTKGCPLLGLTGHTNK